MTNKIVLGTWFLLSASLFYFVSPSWGCGVYTKCIITCYDSSGHQIGEPVPCVDSTQVIHRSCECDTEYNGSGTAACHSHCSTITGQDTFCTF